MTDYDAWVTGHNGWDHPDMQDDEGATSETTKVVFVGIDHWGRPIFQQIGENEFYGALDKLFSDHAPHSEILNRVKAEDLVYFGTEFGCEPDGTPEVVEIVLEEL